MRELFLQPEIQSFQTFSEFALAHKIGKGDLLLTNEPILPSFQAEIPEGVRVICTEIYGKGEPSDIMFDRLTEAVYQEPFNRVIAVGGGAVIDVAKALCAADGKGLDELFDADPASLKRTKTLFCLPTTCGTGSEVTVTAVFDRTRKNTKMGLTNYALGTDCAVLIPALLKSVPQSVFASSSIDALIHAIESYLDGKQATIASQMFSERAITMILPIYRKLRIDGFETRGQYLLDLQLASNFAGIAIANALPSAAHAMSYPFANKFHRPHGEACYVFLNATLQKYLRDVESGKLSEERVKTWRGMMEIIARGLDMAGAPDKELLQALDELLYFILPRKTLKEYGAQPEDCVEFGRHCYEQQQRLMTCAFSEFSEQELIEAYQSVYE